jgi:hypothetical protein
LKGGERLHPSIYRGCSYAREEMVRKKTQKTAAKGDIGRTFSSRCITPEHSFAATPTTT